MRTNKYTNYERIYKNNYKSFNEIELEKLFYNLQDCMIEKSQYEAVLKEHNITKSRIEGKINSIRYESYSIIKRIIANGGNKQVNRLAICFLNSEIKKDYRYIKKAKPGYKGSSSCVIVNKKSSIKEASKMIEKLRYDARLY